MMSTRGILAAASVVSAALWLSAAAAQFTESKLVPGAGQSGDGFGMAVAASGDYLVIGAPQSDEFGSQSGSAYIFRRSGGAWIEDQKLLPSDGAYGARFGMAVSIDGDCALIGAYTDPELGIHAGAAYVFQRDSLTGEWNEQIKLKASDGEAGDRFGFGVSLQGRWALIGAMEDEDEAGAAFLFERTDTGWTEYAKLTASGGVGTALFGRSVCLSGDYAIIGSPYDEEIGHESGAAYVFHLDGGNWIQQAKLLSSDIVADDYFGFSVAISGDYAIVGALSAWGIENSAGAAYVFQRIDSTWTEQAKMIDSTGVVGLGFGYSVSIDGSHVVVGQPSDDDNGVGSGSAFVFERVGADWILLTKLLASDGVTGDGLGWATFIHNDEVFAGAPNQEAGGTLTGAAYVFAGLSTDVEEGLEGILTGLILKQNYPNPFSSGTSIRFSIAVREHVNVNVYDVAGRLVRTLAREELQPGWHTVEWNGSDDSGEKVAAGMYFLRMKSEDFTSVKKAVLLR